MQFEFEGHFLNAGVMAVSKYVLTKDKRKTLILEFSGVFFFLIDFKESHVELFYFWCVFY